MSEKRFLGAYGKTNKILEKGKCDYDLDYAEDVQKVVDLLNSLSDENEQLRKELKNRSAFIVDKGLGDTFIRWKNE